LLQKMKQFEFYPVAPTDVDWSSEEKKLRHVIKKVLV